MTEAVIDVPVLIAGGGPVGLALAADLGWRGVKCLLVEKHAGVNDHPRATLLGARSMEYYRRWGIAERVIEAGLPLDYPIHVIFTTHLRGHELHRARFASMGEFMAHRPGFDKVVPDAKYSPYFKTQIGQQALEPVVRAFAGSQPGVDLRYSAQLQSFTQDADGVTATVAPRDGGSPYRVHAKYLVGCDGGKSLVRSTLGIEYFGRGAMRPNVSFFFRSSEFLESHSLGGGTLYFLFNPNSFGVFTAINGRDLWNYQHYFLDPNASTRDVDVQSALFKAMGRPFAFELLKTTHWHHHQSVAEHYRDGRVFLAGDAAHLFCPTGGVGMNTGIGDAINLGWKLQAVLSGWAPDSLLDSYEIERKPVAVRNSTEAAANADRIDAEMHATPENIENDDAAGEAARAELSVRLQRLARQFNASGLQLGHRYDGSPICIGDGTPPPPDDPNVYVPTARPGSRTPHLWLADGRSTLDLFSGKAFTLLRLGADAPDVSVLQKIAAERAIPLSVESIDQPDVCDAYAARLVLVRPDGYIAWRGDRLADSVEAISACLGTVCGFKVEMQNGARQGT